MEFLGDSQTFLGVISSFLILCIVINESNFIYNILDDIKIRISREIDKFDKDTDSQQINTISNSSDYKLFERYILELNQKKKNNEITANEEKVLGAALNMELKIKTIFNKIKSSPSGETLKPAHGLLNNIILAKELVIAPMYALFCCVIVFICDEIVVGIPNSCDSVVTFLSIFISSSTIFWIMVWYNFIRHIRLYHSESKFFKYMKSICTKFKIRKGWLLMICALVYCLSFYVSVFITIPFIKWAIAFIVGMLLSILLVAFAKVYSYDESFSFTHEFGIKHFLMFVLISGLYTIITFLMVSYIDGAQETCILYNNLFPLKICVLFFVMVIGLVLPFLMPFWGYMRVQKAVKNRLKESEQAIQKELTVLKNELESFCNNSIPLISH